MTGMYNRPPKTESIKLEALGNIIISLIRRGSSFH